MSHKIIFTGPVGAGKTTSIAAISDKQVVSTEANVSDEVRKKKQTTTVALDYGVLNLDEGTSVHLYGTPGQKRFEYMWGILAKGGLGLVVLIDNSLEQPVEEMAGYLKGFEPFMADRPVCIGVTRMEVSPVPRLSEYHSRLADMGVVAPVFEIDARESNDVKTLIRSLLHRIEV